MEIIGQTRVKNFIDSSTLDSFPRTLLLTGEYGSGKHLFCNFIAEKFELIQENISDKITQETIDNINSRVTLCQYVIDSDKISIKEENTVLKLLEEPPKSAFIVIVCENPAYLIHTVKNRCYNIRLDRYTQGELETFLGEYPTDILAIANTPGQILNLFNHPVSGMLELATKIFTSIANANFANTLTISDKLAFKLEKDKFDYKIFFKILLNVVHKLLKESQNADYRLYEAYKLTNELYNQQFIAHIDCKLLFENYLCKLRKCMRGEAK